MSACIQFENGFQNWNHFFLCLQRNSERVSWSSFNALVLSWSWHNFWLNSSCWILTRWKIFWSNAKFCCCANSNSASDFLFFPLDLVIYYQTSFSVSTCNFLFFSRSETDTNSLPILQCWTNSYILFKFAWLVAFTTSASSAVWTCLSFVPISSSILGIIESAMERNYFTSNLLQKNIDWSLQQIFACAARELEFTCNAKTTCQLSWLLLLW